MSKINLQEPQRHRNATANFVNLIMTSTVSVIILLQLEASFCHKTNAPTLPGSLVKKGTSLSIKDKNRSHRTQMPQRSYLLNSKLRSHNSFNLKIWWMKIPRRISLCPEQLVVICIKDYVQLKMQYTKIFNARGTPIINQGVAGSIPPLHQSFGWDFKPRYASRYNLSVLVGR